MDVVPILCYEYGVGGLGSRVQDTLNPKPPC